MRKNKFCDIQNWFPIKNFENYIYTKDDRSLAVFEVKTINFKLKSEGEQIAILEAYKRFLKQCNFDIQIVVSSFKVDVCHHINNVEKYSYGNDKLLNMKNSYIELISKLIDSKTSVERRFFMIIRVDKNFNENVSKILSCLESCGNEVIMCDSILIEKLLKNYFKRNVKDESY